MPQLHLYLPEEIAKELKRRAKAERMSVSKYLAQLVQSQIAHDWPEEFFSKVVGGWAGEPLKRPDQFQPEVRDEL